jgi:hypothetical protein
MVNRMNIDPVIGTKRVRNNSGNGKVLKTSGREVEIQPIQIGVGMGCPRTGIPRYLKMAKDRFDDKGIVSAFFDYTVNTGNYGIVKNIDKIVKGYGTPNVNSRIIPSKQPHFFMVGMRTTGGGHAVSILIDPTRKYIWVFDPHGEYSRQTVYGQTMRKKIVPIIKKMWKIPTQRVRYYNGPNLQADNTRGTCSTYYVTFMDMIPYLLSGQANIDQIERLATMNSTAIRQFYLDFAPQNVGRIIAKNIRKTS